MKVSEAICDKLQMHRFLDGIHIPIVSEILRDDLDKDITTEEIGTAIDDMKAGKTPEPNDFPTEIYKMFQNRLKMSH